MDLASGRIWEPRVLWDVARQANTSQVGGVRQTRFNKANFRNGGRYPIELRYTLIAPVGYALNEFIGQNVPAVLLNGDYGACASVLQNASVMISVPNRQHYSLEPVKISTWLAEPTDDISMRYSSVQPGASGLFGAYRWDFCSDRRPVLPRNACASFWLGPFLRQPSPATNTTYTYRGSIGFHEEGIGHAGPKNFMRNAKTRVRANMPLSELTDTTMASWQAADGLGSVAFAQGLSADWPGSMALREKDYKEQESARDGYNMVTGYSVAIDQITFDDSLIASGLANAASSRVAPIGHRIPTRARFDAFSQEWWWREGAPLSLVCPTLTPALVYKLPKPLWLHPGDTIEVEMETPGGVNISGTDVFAIYQMGLSFAGYAEIRG